MPGSSRRRIERYHDEVEDEAQRDNLISGDNSPEDSDSEDFEMGALQRDESLEEGQAVEVVELGGVGAKVRRPLWRRIFDGPERRRSPHVTLVLPKYQLLADKLIARFIPKSLICGSYFLVLLVWGLIFFALAKTSILANPKIDGEDAVLLRCGYNTMAWGGREGECGINGTSCLHPEGAEIKFKCPADCIMESYTWAEYPVGIEEIVYRPLVIGTDNNYRADSYICAAAMHHGIVSDRRGGCGVVKFGPPKTEFKSSDKNGIQSIPFDSYFPQSFSFSDSTHFDFSGCSDFRWPIIAVNIVFSFIFAYFISTPSLFFWPLFIMGFWTVILASNPPLSSGPNTKLVIAELVSLAFRRFLPAMLSSYLLYVVAVKPQLKGLNANLTRSVMWVGGLWIGLLENFIFSHLPLDRLTVHDLNARAGAWITLLIIIGAIIAIAIGQAYIIWRMGKLKQYLSLYIGMGLLLGLLSAVPNETLRIHHYIISLLLLPGSAFQTTPSLFYQGLLMGLYIAGVARWDYDSVLQTYDQLRRGAPSLIGGLPEFAGPTLKAGQAVLNWLPIHGNADLNAEGTAWDSFSLSINDIEFYHGPATSFSLTDWINSLPEALRSAKRYYLRLAYATGNRIGDYTRAAVVDLTNEKWVPPKGGSI